MKRWCINIYQVIRSYPGRVFIFNLIPETRNLYGETTTGIGNMMDKIEVRVELFTSENNTRYMECYLIFYYL